MVQYRIRIDDKWQKCKNTANTEQQSTFTTRYNKAVLVIAGVGAE